MDKKAFYFIALFVVIVFSFTMLLKYVRPASAGDVDFSDFPMKIGNWSGERREVSQTVWDLLNPQDALSATYVNDEGVSIHLFFDYFSSDATYGGPHSPRNCGPGSGWIIMNTHERDLAINDRNIPAGRFDLQYDQSLSTMDFWYVTHFGETADDYQFKLFELYSALLFKPRDVAFIRFITDSDSTSLAGLAEFEQQVSEEIYKHLPF